MNYRIFLLFIATLFLNSLLNAQHTVNVNIKYGNSEPFLSDFRIVKVIDNRISKDYIGMVKTGMANKKKSAIFKKPFTDEIQALCDKILGTSTSKKELIMKVSHFWISEKTTFFKESGKVEIRIEMLVDEDGSYKSIGQFSEKYEKGAVDITKKLGRMIPEAFKNVFIKYMHRKTDAITYDRDPLNFNNGYPKELNKGAFNSFDDLRFNKTVGVEDIKVEVFKNTDFVTKYKVTNNGKTLKEFAYYSGTVLLLNSYLLSGEATSYVRPKTKGRYLVYPYRSPDGGAAAAFGIIGAIASDRKRLSLLDTKTGLLQDITSPFLANIIAEYDDIDISFIKEEFDLERIINIIQEVNNRIMD